MCDCGGTGVGKSSLLHYILRTAKERDYSAEFYTNPDSFYSDIEKVSKKKSVVLIDDVGKASEDDARKFYAYGFVEKLNPASCSLTRPAA